MILFMSNQMRKATLCEGHRSAYENHELARADLSKRVFDFTDKGLFDNAMVVAKFGRIVYGGSLIGARRERRINARVHNKLGYSFDNFVDSLLEDIEFLRGKYSKGHDSVANSNPLDL